MTDLHVHLTDAERVFWLFPRGAITAGSGVTLDLDAAEDAPAEGKVTWATALGSIQAWVQHYRPPILREHERNGESYGEIVRVIEVTEDQARDSFGVEQRGDALWGVARLHPTMRDAYDDGRLRTTSPHLAMGYTDDEGQEWPLAMLELSAVSDPRQKGRQVTTDHLSGVRLSESLPRITVTQAHEAKMGEEYEARLASCEGKLAEIDESLGEMKAMLGQLMEGESEESQEMMDAPEEEMSEKLSEAQNGIIAKLASENAALTERLNAIEDERANERAESTVAAAYGERQLDPSKRAEYVALAKRDAALFELAISAAPLAPKRKIGSTVGTGIPAGAGAGTAARFQELLAEHGDAAKAHKIWSTEVK